MGIGIQIQYTYKYNEGLRSETGHPLDKKDDEKIRHRQQEKKK